MPTEMPRVLLEIRYHEAAQEYLRNLPLEHFMEATPQATQREITLESLALLRGRRPDVYVFNELLVQYQRRPRKPLGQVVPDNMVVIHPKPIEAEGSYDVPLQPVGPFWVLEYVSKNNARKDYDDNMRKYEHELKVPYYLLFVPEQQELTLYRHNGRRYVSVKPDTKGRLAIPELDLALGVLGSWVRFWHKGELLPLPAELQHALDETRQQLNEMTRRAESAERELVELRKQMEKPRTKKNGSG
jgi:Uma2 family endonuclease